MVPVNYDIREVSIANDLLGSSIADGDFVDDANATSTGKSVDLDFTGGKTIATFTETLDNDEVPEGNSMVTVTLTAETGGTSNIYTVAASPDNATTTTITDDDILKLPTLSFTTTSFSTYEDVGNFAVQVGLDRVATQEVTYTIAVSSEGGQNAVYETDYDDPDSLSGSIAIDGDRDTIMIPIINDNSVEENETFTLTLSALSGAVFDGQVSELTEVITIKDDDSLPMVSIALDSGTVAEDAGSGHV